MGSSPAHRPPSRLARFGLLVAGLAVGAASGEGVVRMSGLARPWHPAAEVALYRYYTDPNGAVELVPGWSGWVSGAPTAIGDHGYRERPVTTRPAPGVLRIAAVGDSYTMGDGVGVEEAYPRVLERLLRERGWQVEVLNCGLSGTNTSMQAASLPRVLDRFSPDLVLVGLNLNDLQIYRWTRTEELTAGGADLVVHPDGRVSVRKRPSTRLAASTLWLRHHSAVFRLAAQVAALRPGSLPDLRERVQRWIAEGGMEAAIEAARTMDELTRRRGARLVVALVPALLEMPEEVERMEEYPYRREHAELCARLSARAIPCLDLLPAFAGARPAELIVHRSDRHYNATGHRILAEALAARLEPYRRGARSEPIFDLDGEPGGGSGLPARGMPVVEPHGLRGDFLAASGPAVGPPEKSQEATPRRARGLPLDDP